MLYIGSRPIIHTEVKTKYADWIKRAIDKYGFEEGIDFTILKNGNGNNIECEKQAKSNF